MGEHPVWPAVLVGLYWAACLAVGLRGGRLARTAGDYFVAGRTLPPAAFALAGAAVPFSAWAFFVHPGLVFRDGFAAALVGLGAVAVPLGGVFLLKRQWLLGRRFGYMTPGEMLAGYYGGEAVRLLAVAVTLLFTVPYLAIHLVVAGRLFGGVFGETAAPAAVWGLALVLFVYVAVGGLGAVSRIDAAQFALVAVGTLVLAGLAVAAAGGWDALAGGLARLARAPGPSGTTRGLGGGDYSLFFAMPGAASAAGGAQGSWPGTLTLSSVLALLGLQATPAFSLWAFASPNPRPFAAQQVWTSGLAAGFLLVVAAPLVGLAGRLGGGAGPDQVTGGFLAGALAASPWLGGLLLLAGLAALQAATAVHLAAAAAALARDVYKRHLNPGASHTAQKLFARLAAAAVLAGALLVAGLAGDGLAPLMGLAVAFAAQLLVPLAGVCWLPGITARAAAAGLVAGAAAVVLTDLPGPALLEAAGVEAWGRWPLAIHPAGWGLMVNAAVCLIVSRLSDGDDERARRLESHAFLARHAVPAGERRPLLRLGGAAALAWLLFGVGPGAVLGNDIFGPPHVGPQGWTFGIPSMWAWQILFWLLGVALLWSLARGLGFSAMTRRELAELAAEAGAPPADD